MKVRLLLFTSMCVAWGLAHPVLSQQSAQPPRFTVMRLELTVLDKRTRKPIVGLTAEDFVVKVGGKAQAIEAFEEVRVAARSASQPRSAWRHCGRRRGASALDRHNGASADLFVFDAGDARLS